MQTAKLLIRKAMMNVQGRTRPCIQVQAALDPRMHALLTEHFLSENLFKRSTYQNGFPEGAPPPGAALAPHLANLIKNDACPEITVKTILSGQLFQANNIWEVMAFEYIARRAFDSLTKMMACVAEVGTETQYFTECGEGGAADRESASAVRSEVPPGPAPVAERAPNGLANAA